MKNDVNMYAEFKSTNSKKFFSKKIPKHNSYKRGDSKCMFKFTTTGVNLISLSITTFIFMLIQIFMYQYTNGLKMEVEIGKNIMDTELNSINTINQEIKSEKWQLEIPVINLKADIAEGTTTEILNEYIGHFEETSVEDGNIGLAAHNRGYPVNYFADLKKLKEGDKIIYTYNTYERKYQVIQNKIIKDTDWNVLEDEEKNELTLITCVENEPKYRRCIKAIQEEE